MHPVPLSSVTLHDGFWRDRVERNRTVAIPALYERLDAHGVIANFRPGAPRQGLWFTDSDLYKWMEAAAWSLVSTADPALDALLERTVADVVGAQQPDGYLNTNFAGDRHFGDLSWSHELYCAGHLFQAAVAHHGATGRTALLDAAVRFADLLVATFSERDDRDRHPVVEMALVDLARVTGNERYRALAASFCDRVGHGAWDRLWGHAVCALYFASGCTDLVLDGDDARRPAVERWWHDLVHRSSYVTGGVGGRWVAESMGRPYELPHEGAYAESCASVAVTQWAWRMLQLTGDTAIGDHMELVLHNALAASVSCSGDEWFYANPLASSDAHEQHPFIGDDLPLRIAGPLPLRRSPWRDVTCCPPNVTRLLASLASYCYMYDDDELRVVLYLPSRVRAGAFDVEIVTRMPWSGEVTIRVHAAPTSDAAITVRIPAWSIAPDAGRWRTYRRVWQPGEEITFDLGVRATTLVANPRVAETRGAVAVRRGPMVYCMEAIDNPGIDLRDVVLTSEAFDERWDDSVAAGVVALRAPGAVRTWRGPLYGPAGSVHATSAATTLTFVPYAVWANRGAGPMTVWCQADGIGRHNS